MIEIKKYNSTYAKTEGITEKKIIIKKLVADTMLAHSIGHTFTAEPDIALELCFGVTAILHDIIRMMVLNL